MPLPQIIHIAKLPPRFMCVGKISGGTTTIVVNSDHVEGCNPKRELVE